MSNNIKSFREAANLSMQALADAAGTSAAQINKLEKGERRLTVDWMIRLARPLGVSPADLMSYVGKEFATHESENGGLPDLGHGSEIRFAPAPPPASYADLIPVRSAARGGDDQMMFLQDGPIDHVPRPAYLANVRDAYAIYVIGTSMVPMYRPGQLLFINPYRPPAIGRGVVIYKHNQAVIIKELIHRSPEALTLREYHPEPRDFTLALATIREVHSVVGAQEP